MKAIEILQESKVVKEEPSGVIKQGLQRVGAGVAHALGAKNLAGKLSGSADLGSRANDYSGEFRKFLARQNKHINDAEYSDVLEFLRSNGLPTLGITNAGPVGADTLDRIFTKVAQKTFSGGSYDENDAPRSTRTNVSSSEPDSKIKQITQAFASLRPTQQAKLISMLQASAKPIKQKAKPKAAAPAQPVASKPTPTAAPQAKPAPVKPKPAARKKVPAV